MMHNLKPLFVGIVGSLATLTAEKFNVYAGGVIAVLTIAALIPLCVTRWKKFLQKESSKSVAPFSE